MIEPLTEFEESFLRAYLADNKAKWLSGDFARNWMAKSLATIEGLKNDVVRQHGIIQHFADRIAAQSEQLTRGGKR